MIKINNLDKEYNKQIVINNASISLKAGKLYIFTGINGSGKSTILKIISKVIFKTKGDIQINGSVSYLPDRFILPRLMNVKKYIEILFKLYRIKSNVNELLKEYEIPNKSIRALSKGNLQKLGILQIINNPCDIYIFDEPLDGLDEFAKRLFKDKVCAKLAEGKTILMSLHTKNLFNDLSPIIFDVKEGKINEKRKKS